MASSPLVADFLQLTITNFADLARYQRGQEGLYVFGYLAFMSNGYAEPPQWINFEKQMFFPRNRNWDTFRFGLKPGVLAAVRPIYGNLDALAPIVQGEAINLMLGAVKGLRVYAPDGTPGPIPEFVPVP